MKRKSKRKQKHVAAKSVLRLTGLEVAKSAVLNSLTCSDAQRGYRHAIDEFVGEAVTEKLVWHVVKEFAAKIGVTKLAPRGNIDVNIIGLYQLHIGPFSTRSGNGGCMP